VRLVTAALAALVAMVVGASPAAAHAELIATDPAEGAVLPEAPATVTLTFNESVRLTSQEITVYDADGQAVDSEATSSGTEVRVDLPGAADLGRGTYVVGWYVLSADGHPISGALTFSVGERSDHVAQPPPPPSSSRVVTATQGVLTGVTYLGLLVAAGLAAFVALILPSRYAGDRVRARITRLVRIAAAVAAGGAVLQVPVASVYSQGQELTDLVSGFDPELVMQEIGSAVLIVVGFGLVVGILRARPPGPEHRVALLVGAGLAVVAPAMVGHTRAYQPQALLVVGDAVHLSAAAIWLGGLVGLGLALPALAGREQLAASTLARFSTIAAGLLLAVAATGTLLAWRILGSWSALVDTRYGTLLMVKIGLALVVATLGAWNRFGMLPRVRRAAGFADRGRAAALVTRTVTAEALVIVVLLGVTGFLVSRSPRPAPVDVPPGETGVQQGRAGELQVLAVMTPREHGPNTLLVQIQDADGEPVTPAGTPEVSLRSGDMDLGTVPLVNADVGTYHADLLLPRAGTWEVQVSLPLSRFENPVTTVRFDVAEVTPP
jgi:copper transport protein